MSDAENVLDTPLQFDRVVHADPTAGAPKLACAQCGRPVVEAYYHAPGRMLCTSCGAAAQLEARPDTRAVTLARAGLYGFGACLAGAFLYWAVMEYLGLEIGIVAIAIGFMVGRAVAVATRGRSARRHRVLAVLLTYMAVGMAYAPIMFKAIDEKKPAATASPAASAGPAATTSKTEGAAPAAGASTSAQAAAAPKDEPAARTLAVGVLALLAMVLALPVLGAVASGAGGILSIVIIGFGLRQAWRVAAASNVTVVGPLPVTGATPA